MLDQLANQLFRDLQAGLDGLESAAPADKLKALIQSRLKAMDLVSREEFDAQTAVLEKNREKLQLLEQQLEELEQQLNGAGPDKTVKND